MNIKQFFLIPPVILLASCSSPKPLNIKYTYIPQQSKLAQGIDANSQAALAQTANNSGSSLTELSAISQAKNPQVKIGRPLDAAIIGMAQHGSLKWNGPVENALQQIADHTGYKFKTLGSKPATPIIVNVDQKNVPLADILRNIRYQVANAERGNIAVYPASHVLELRYNNN